MKAIGSIPLRGGDYKLIVEMTQEEWKAVSGSPSAYAKVSIGSTVAVHKVFSRSAMLRDNQEKLAEARQSLRAIANLLEPLEGVVGCDPEFTDSCESSPEA